MAPDNMSPAASESPFSLRHFLPAGTVELTIGPHVRPFLLNHTEHALSEGSWHDFGNAEFMQTMIEPSCDELCRALWYLSRHKFIAATYTTLNELSLVLVRVYLIPFDLANVQGKLSYRARKKEVLALARTYMTNLLPKIVQDSCRWEGDPPLSGTSPRMFIKASVDRRTLPEIYSDLLSPTPSRADDKSIINRLLDCTDDLGGLGIRSTLHRYQRRSVAAMLQKERSGSSDIPNPLYIPLTGLDGKVFYYQPGTTEILREQYMVSSTLGGVLCEELGTGKTVIVLALIRATMNEISQPEESLIDVRPILTPLAFRHFPSGEFATSRERILRGNTRKGWKNDPVATSGSRVPSLRELLLHLLCSKPDISTPHTTALLEARQHKMDLLEQLHSFGDWRKANTPFYLHYKGEPSDFRSSSRGSSNPGPKVMYLSSATLIVVPPNLVSQWDREIKKHCEEIPRLLIVRPGVSLPPAKELASEYDIILMTYTRFNDEDKTANANKLHSWKLCKCPEFPGSRVPQCACSVPGVSSLLQVRWRRLVIDEGHVSSSISTRLTPFTKLLSVQSRWTVTGTPTTNLLGLSFGSSSSEFLDQGQNQDIVNDSNIETPEDMSESISRAVSEDTDSVFSPEPQVARVWTEHDSMDIHKLLNMIVHFVGVKFLGDSLIRTHVKEALFDNRGPRPGAITMLEQLMNMVMIRHRIKDVEEEVVLPKLTQKAVFLDLDPYMRLSYNALQAAIAINAIDSQRTDQDYMFHRSNVEFLQLTVKNMSQLMFWHVDERLYNAIELSRSIVKILEEAENKKLPPEDVALAQEALTHIRLALQDKLWSEMQTHVDIPYHVYDLPISIFKSWSRLYVPDADAGTIADRTTGELVHRDRLWRLQELVVRRPLIDQETLIEGGKEVAESDRMHRLLFEEQMRQKEKSRASKRHHHEVKNTSDLKSLNASKNAAASSTIKEMQQELRASLARLELLEQSDSEDLSNNHSPQTIKIRPSALLSSSLIANVRIGASASSKLNYIIEEVQKYSSDEKFLIFSDSELTLAHVGEALELLQLKYLRFSTQISPQLREQLVLTFETSDTYRVFLMELKHGARGLNLVSASRVIFCEPVWQADIESQAIKRAHRIGQVRPVTVKTLAIRGTAEEKMIERRERLRQTGDKIPKLLEESGMRHFIANPKFIKPAAQPENAVPQVNFPLLRILSREGSNQTRVPVSGSTATIGTPAHVTPPVTSSRKRVRVEEPMDHQSSNSVSLVSSPTKKKVVRFG